MFYFISGKLAALDPCFAVVDANGVGYKMTISLTTYSKLASKSANESVTLYSHLAVREDGIELYGFDGVEELEAFKLLITVSGVGPKAAMSILSQLTPQRLTVAICSEDKKSISNANGIGPKTAARIILELKDKLSKAPIGGNGGSVEFDDTAVQGIPNSNKLSDAQEALMALGYSRTEAQSALRTIDTSKYELDDIIRLALKKIMR